MHFKLFRDPPKGDQPGKKVNKQKQDPRQDSKYNQTNFSFNAFSVCVAEPKLRENPDNFLGKRIGVGAVPQCIYSGSDLSFSSHTIKFFDFFKISTCYTVWWVGDGLHTGVGRSSFNFLFGAGAAPLVSMFTELLHKNTCDCRPLGFKE
jgi:hypothetical protein